ncbi:MAG: prepilin-type N-terminal cleavage/methylation domain-containing protein [Oscillospiraceae bacterium]|nr:prepilin-type N-terminal cleavage/methylation domain-containing protein [Oscillospiraceae bacterium]
MIKKLQALRAKKGFTLVELIVVIAIIGVLAAILIPTLSGVIESSRKRSAESTCQSIQNLAKTFAAQVMAKTGQTCTATSTVDMDDGVTTYAAGTKCTMKEYIENQIPELSSSATPSTLHAAAITLTNGEVTQILYTEGSFTAKWTSTGGLAETEKDSASAVATQGVAVS